MKILMVNKFLYPNGGSETYLFGLGEQLEKMGHKVQYFGMEHAGRIVGNSVQSYTANMDFHTGKLQKFLYPFKIIYSMEARKKIRLVLEDFKPDVVHLNNINFQLTPSILYEIRAFEKERKHPVRIVYTAHDYQWVCPNHMMCIPASGRLCFDCKGGKFGACTRNRCIHGSLVKSMLGTMEATFYKLRRTYRMVDSIICPSEFIKEKLDTDPILRTKTIMLHNFVEMPEWAKEENGKADGGAYGKACEAWEKLQTKLPKRYVLYFGRFSKEKGVGTLLRACQKLPQVSFVFAGTGPLTDEIGQAANIRNVGFISGDALYNLITGAEFSVYPSEWYENCPFSVMESQRYGTPIIASDMGGIPELVQDGVSGELFRAGDLTGLTEKIDKLWRQPALCRKYRKNCKNIKFDTIEEYCGKIIRQVYS